MRERILDRLTAAGDGYISGERLSGDLGISRAAVWKHMAALRRQGYQIEARPRLGYRLAKRPDRLDPALVRAGLTTRVLGCRIRYLPSCGSTNLVAKELAAAGAPEGTLVLTEEQTAGRGRLGRRWVAPFGSSLLMSVLLRPALPPAEVPSLGLSAAVAVAAAVQRCTGLSPGLKWPNDLLLEGRKAGGILLELAAEGDMVHHAVLGVGLNVNVAPASWPGEVASRATSLAAVLGRAVDRLALLRGILAELEERYRIWQEGGFAALRAEWIERNVTLGREVTVATPRGVVRGRAWDVDREGRLLLDLEDGERLALAAGEVTLSGDNVNHEDEMG